MTLDGRRRWIALYVLCLAEPELRELASFAGLTGVLRLEPRRQAEEREEPLGVEEERQLHDPAA